MNKNIISGLAIAALTVSSATAFAGKGHHKELYNPNVAPLDIVNTISDVHGGVAGFIRTAVRGLPSCAHLSLFAV